MSNTPAVPSTAAAPSATKAAAGASESGALAAAGSDEATGVAEADGDGLAAFWSRPSLPSSPRFDSFLESFPSPFFDSFAAPSPGSPAAGEPPGCVFGPDP
jgi:hypothetical protein